MNYLLITGSPTSAETAQMEVIDNLGQTRLCQQNHSLYPLEVSQATAIYTNGRILACGGFLGSTNSDQCYSFEKDKGWTELAKMNQARRQIASMQIDGGMIVIGGDGSNSLKSSQIIYSNGSAITEGPELPETRRGHCMAYDKENDVFFVTGGYKSGFKSTVWKFNDPEKFILNGTTQMKHTRFLHGCGIVRSSQHDKRPLLVVAGSYPPSSGGTTCEFFDYTKADSQWQLCSQDLPVSMNAPRITTSGKVDHMIMTFNKGIYHFKCVSSDSCFFEKEADELKISRSFHILLSVPAALVEDC